MSKALDDLRRRRVELLNEFAKLSEFRSGSVTAVVRRCGKSGCRCSQPGDPGHGPNFRITFKVNGRTCSDSLPTKSAIEKARREIAEYQKFRALTREFVDVNTKICRLGPADDRPAIPTRDSGESERM
jgi:hypothetical protein